MGYMTDGLTFNTLRGGNLARLPQFKNSKGEPAHSEADGSDWSISDWTEAVLGELGEFANFHKKRRRGDLSEEEFLVEAKKELADVAIYLDILAYRCGVDLGQAVMEKFNETSRKVGSTVYLDAEDWHFAESPEKIPGNSGPVVYSGWVLGVPHYCEAVGCMETAPATWRISATKGHRTLYGTGISPASARSTLIKVIDEVFG